MNGFTSYRLLITPLSPIHIGAGECYEPTNYVIEDGILHEFDTGSLVEALSDGDRKALLDITNRRPDTEMIKAIQRYFYDRRAQLIPWTINHVPVLPGVANLYASRIGKTANRETDGGQVVNRMEIDRTGYNPITRLPVLFGSSLKGAIRTALLNKINDGKSAEERKGLHEFQGRIFKYLNDREKPILELDPMRLVQLSDAIWKAEPVSPATQVYLAVNRKKAPVVDEQGKLRKSKVESGNGPDQILECISGWRYRAFTGQVNLQSVDRISGQNKKGQRQIPADNLRFDKAQIASACNNFYRPILESENQLMRGRGYLDATWAESIENFLKSQDERMRRGEVFLLRVGRHSGAESVTLNGVRNIKIMLDKDPETGKNRSTNEPGARTIWLAAVTKDQPDNLLPFGWLLVELQFMDEPIKDWPELKHACEPHLQANRAIATKLAEIRTEIERVRREAETKRREEAEQERLQAEEAARMAQEEAKRQARIATMTPEEREIEAFREVFENAKAKGPYNASDSIYNGQRLELFRAAIDWSDKNARLQAAILLRESIGWSGWPGKKERKAEFRAWLESLEGQA